MLKSLNKFKVNIDRVRLLGGIYSSITLLTTPALDLSDILRAELVLAVSALDAFVHDITLAGMLEIARGERKPVDKYYNFPIPIKVVHGVIGGGVLEECLADEVWKRHGYMSFQHPDKISEALRCFCEVNVWKEISTKRKVADKDVKNTLRLIVERRNKIAHEADMDPSFPHLRWPVSEEIVNVAVDFIDELCGDIYELVRENGAMNP